MESAEALRMRIDQMLLMWDILRLLSGYNPKGFSRERAERALEAVEIDPDLLTLERGDSLKGAEELLRLNAELIRGLTFLVPEHLCPECRKLADAVVAGRITEEMLKEPTAATNAS